MLAVILSDVMFFLLESNQKYTFFAQDNKVCADVECMVISALAFGGTVLAYDISN